MYVNQFSAIIWLSNVLSFSLIKSVFVIFFKRIRLQMLYFQALRNTIQCNYSFKGLHCCEKTNQKIFEGVWVIRLPAYGPHIRPTALDSHKILTSLN